MNFDFYKPYLKPLFGWPSITEVDKLLSDIFEYNSDISKILNIDGLINIDYQKHNDNDIPYIFKNGFNIFYVDEVKDGYFEMIMDFNLFLEVYICAKCLYHELGSELYDSILDYFKWCIKVNYIGCIIENTKQFPRFLGLLYAVSSAADPYVDPDMESLYRSIESIISSNIKYKAYQDYKKPIVITTNPQPDWYSLIIDNWNDIYKSIKQLFIDSSWYQNIVKVGRYSDINPLVITPEETFESLDGISHVLGCILCRIHFNEIIQPYINALPHLSESEFRYYKLEKGIEWISDEEPPEPSPLLHHQDIKIELSYDDTIDVDLLNQFPFLRKIPLNEARAFQYVWKYNNEEAHHKQWVIDQMLQKLLTEDEYDQYIKAYIKWYNEGSETKVDETDERLSEEIHGIAP